MVGSILWNSKKYRGKTLEWILFHDPGYIAWMVGKGIKAVHAEREFDELVAKASHLKVPGECRYCRRNPITRMALFEHPSGGLADVEFFCADCEPQSGQYLMVRPSLLVSEHLKSYDKLGGKFLVNTVRHAYELPKVLRQPDMERFFATKANFTLP